MLGNVPPLSLDLKLNLLCAKFFRGNKNIYEHFMLFLYIDMTQVIGILPHGRRRLCLFHIANIMAADDLAMQGTRASTSMVLT